jgi:hypothetical protein
MGFAHAFWYLTNEVIYVLNTGEPTLEDLRDVDRQIVALMQQAQAEGATRIHVFIDSTRMDNLPDLGGGRILHYLNEPICGVTVMVGNNKSFLPIISRFLTDISQVRLYMFNTLEQGKKYAETNLHLSEPLPDPNEITSEYLAQSTNV